MRYSFLFFIYSTLWGYVIDEKVIICGVAKNVALAIPNTIRSIETIGKQFTDYAVIIYENNSDDGTEKLFQEWASQNPKVLFIHEHIPHKQLAKECHMGKKNRTELIARARNIVLNQVLDPRFDDFKYVIVADLDFAYYPWDVDNIVDTILHPEHEWDAVFANGYYDTFALRTPEIPIGYELVGEQYWTYHDQIRKAAEPYFDISNPWKKVYSAFGGLGIYKRDSIKGCTYSGVVTKDLESAVIQWLDNAREQKDIPLWDVYLDLFRTVPIYQMQEDFLLHRGNHPKTIGLCLNNSFGRGFITWFSCSGHYTLPWTCEHIPFHASMILKGHDKLFINPRLISTVAGPP